MAAVSSPKQNLGIFEKDLDRIVDALNRIHPAARTHIGKYVLLDKPNDPEFPNIGSFKKVFYCVSKPLATGMFTVHVALRGDANSPGMVKEERVFTLLSGASGVVQPLLIQPLGKYLYIITELFNRGDLFSFINDQKFCPNGLITNQIGYFIASALAQCHKRGVILRDLKPENILLMESENGTIEPKLTDFGLAFIEDDDNSFDSVSTCGTALYIPVEDFAELEETGVFFLPASPSRDIWALGMILYTLATGKDPVYKIMKGNKVIRTALYPKNKTSLGLYDREIRDILYNTRGLRPDLTSIKKRMGKLLLQALRQETPERKIVPFKYEEYSPLIESENEAPGLLAKISRAISCCFKTPAPSPIFL